MSRPPEGTFRLYPYAKPPIGIGRYLIDGEIDIQDPTDSAKEIGDFEPLRGAFDVEGPRFQLPPDQVLSTYPPSGARGAFGRRLPQIVIRRRTLPWEWSQFPGNGGTPTPWLALVLIAPGEGDIKVDRPIAECVTPGTVLPKGDVFDTPKATYLEVPKTIVDKTFPTASDLRLLTHVREVDMGDTELAMGDDDGWLAVVLCNRLPQPGVTYTACLINVDAQTQRLPVDPEVEESFDRFVVMLDVSRFSSYLAKTAISGDAAAMGAASVPAATSSSVSYSSVASGSVWAAGTVYDAAATVDVGAAPSNTTFVEKPLLGIVDLPYALLGPVFRFPVLTSWSFTCEGDADFASLANEVSSRLLGHVATGPEDPDGGPRTREMPASALTEAPANRPLPLVTETGHVVTAYRTRVGEDQQAYVRGPLIPHPSVRPEAGVPGAVPIAHHADQLRLVVPDGMQDLTYASAFEIGRLLALSRPGVVAMLGEWRRRRFAAATKAVQQGALYDRLAPGLREKIAHVDPLVRVRVVPEVDLPGPRVEPIERPPSARQFVRGLLSVLADDVASVAMPLPQTPATYARDDATALSRARASRLARGLGVDVDLSRDAAALAADLAGVAVARAPRDARADVAGARAALEGLMGELMDGVDALDAGGFAVADVLGRMR